MLFQILENSVPMADLQPHPIMRGDVPLIRGGIHHCPSVLRSHERIDLKRLIAPARTS